MVKNTEIWIFLKKKGDECEYIPIYISSKLSNTQEVKTGAQYHIPISIFSKAILLTESGNTLDNWLFDGDHVVRKRS